MISVVVPVFNEEESLEAFYKELIIVIPILDKNYEIILVDDGSGDKSLGILKSISSKNKNVKIFSFRRNQGKSEALTYGFEKSSGEYVVTLDADLQDKPSEISKILDKAKKENFDLVCGWRKDRKDSVKHILSSKIFNFLARWLWGLKLHDYNCGLKVYKTECAKSLKLYGGLHRFIPLLAYQQGFKIAEIPIIHQKRQFGKSKYGISKIWKDLPDMFTMFFLSKYGKRPMHFFGIIGGALSLAGFLVIVYMYVFIHGLGQAITSRPLFFFGIISLLGGFQIFFTGFLADLIINISHKQDKEPLIKYSSSEE
ncbi:MAG: glycosyltransferase family 2 protein [Candidatus Levybacteria bacterium]|nr:glycosyltransferase family 2 protein [Candidatus Levybacteria bacterium]